MAVRFRLITALFFEIDQGYPYVLRTFGADLSNGAIKTGSPISRVFFLRVLYVCFVPKNEKNFMIGFYGANR